MTGVCGRIICSQSWSVDTVLNRCQMVDCFSIPGAPGSACEPRGRQARITRVLSPVDVAYPLGARSDIYVIERFISDRHRTDPGYWCRFDLAHVDGAFWYRFDTLPADHLRLGHEKKRDLFRLRAGALLSVPLYPSLCGSSYCLLSSTSTSPWYFGKRKRR